MKKILISYIFLLSALSVMADTNVTNTCLENPDFEARFAGWTNNGFYYVTNQSFGKKHGKIYMERWVASGSQIPNVEICQDLYLPAGTYTLTAGCQNIQQSGKIAECTGAKLYANDESVVVTGSNDYNVTFTVLQGVTRIGFKVTSTNANWASIDNVRLTRLTTDIEAEHAELQKLIDNAEEVMGEGEGAAGNADDTVPQQRQQRLHEWRRHAHVACLVVQRTELRHQRTVRTRLGRCHRRDTEFSVR